MARKTALHISKKCLSNIHWNKFWFFLSSPQTYTIVAVPWWWHLIIFVATLIFPAFNFYWKIFNFSSFNTIHFSWYIRQFNYFLVFTKRTNWKKFYEILLMRNSHEIKLHKSGDSSSSITGKTILYTWPETFTKWF
jgi:hypothetical protein